MDRPFIRLQPSGVFAVTLQLTVRIFYPGSFKLYIRRSIQHVISACWLISAINPGTTGTTDKAYEYPINKSSHLTSPCISTHTGQFERTLII